LQPYGIVHGGVHCSVIEDGGELRGGAVVPATVRSSGWRTRPTSCARRRDGRLTATGTPIHRGRLQQLWLVEITDESGRTLARGQVRVQNLPAGRI
jgi:uncharacterized protein (TIGR00369 family)